MGAAPEWVFANEWIWGGQQSARAVVDALLNAPGPSTDAGRWRLAVRHPVSLGREVVEKRALLKMRSFAGVDVAHAGLSQTAVVI